MNTYNQSSNLPELVQVKNPIALIGSLEEIAKSECPSFVPGMHVRNMLGMGLPYLGRFLEKDIRMLDELGIIDFEEINKDVVRFLKKYRRIERLFPEILPDWRYARVGRCAMRYWRERWPVGVIEVLSEGRTKILLPSEVDPRSSDSGLVHCIAQGPKWKSFMHLYLCIYQSIQKSVA